MKIPGDPAELAGVSEHSHQVALMAAVAQYAYEFGKLASEHEALMKQNSECPATSMAHWAHHERYKRLADALEWLHAIPNGGGRGSDKRSAMISGANMKAEGQKKGVSDLCLNVGRQGYRCFYIEMKKPGQLKGESPEQKAFGAWIMSEGGLYAVFDNWHSALRAIMWYLGFEHSKAWPLPE